MSAVGGSGFLARLEIYGVDLEVFGYELLTRHGTPVDRPAPIGSGTIEEAEGFASPLITALREVGLDAIVGTRPAWVDAGDALAADDLATLLPPERTVLVVSGTALPASVSVEEIVELRSAGYRVAVDDAVFRGPLQSKPSTADFVRIDPLAHRDVELEHEIRSLREDGLRLLAGNVGTHDSFDCCRELGFEFFQGRFRTTPRLRSDRRISAEASVRVQLAAQLNNPETDFDELADLIAADVTLSYRLLRYINSAHVGLRRPIVSLREALVALGLRNVRTWATLLLLSDVGSEQQPIVATALLRAHMCRCLANATALAADQAFLVGLMSVVDVLVDRRLDEAIEEIPIDEQLKKALLDQDGPLGDLLDRVIAFERGDFAKAAAAPLNARATTAAYIEAIEWSTRTVSQLAA